MKSIFWFLLLLYSVSAWIECENGEICPDFNVCCETGCVTGNQKEPDPVCCGNGTGCKDGFACDIDESLPNPQICRRVSDDPELPEQTPRVRTCSLPGKVYQEIHGLPLKDGKLAYLSTMGAIDSSSKPDIQRHLRVKTLFIFIHGSLRNVEDYVCGGNAALPESDRDPDSSTTMLVTPWFLAPEDGDIDLEEELRWDLYGEDPERTSYHWRYGGDAINSNTSSFKAIDEMLNRVIDDPIRFPNLRRIIVAGHSAGGQFTQRWALLSNSKAFRANSRDIQLVVGVANPKSFSYFDDRRFVNETLQVPDSEVIASCPFYNEWLWGMEDGLLEVPYKTRSIKEAGGISKMLDRYANRQVIYLAGEKDVVPNGGCMDKLQGDFRRERSEKFFQMLQDFFGRRIHERRVVRDVHHDHCLMFQSEEAFDSLFSGK